MIGVDSPLLFRGQDLALIVGDGPDLLPLLQRLGTGDVLPVANGAGRATVLTSPKGRIVERLFVHEFGHRGVLLVGGSGSAESILAHLAKYTFAERTGVRNASADWAAFGLCGNGACGVLKSAGLPVPEPLGQRETTIHQTEGWVLGHDGADPGGYLVLCAKSVEQATAETLQHAVTDQGGGTADGASLDCVQILRGIPVSGAELNENYNPLEAGLWDAVSFSKGCYVGQEVVARLNTYDKVSRSLVGVEFSETSNVADPWIGTLETADGRLAGVLTRAHRIPGSGRIVGLAYIKKRAAKPGDTVVLRSNGSKDGPERTGTVVELPFPESPTGAV